ECFAGCRASQGRCAKGLAGGSPGRVVTKRGCDAEEADVYTAVGAVAAWAAEGARRGELRARRTAARVSAKDGRSARRLAGLFGGQDLMVAALGDFRAE